MQKNLVLSEHRQILRVIPIIDFWEDVKSAGKLVCVLIQMGEDLLSYLQVVLILSKCIWVDGEEENYSRLLAKGRNNILYVGTYICPIQTCFQHLRL